LTNETSDRSILPAMQRPEAERAPSHAERMPAAASAAETSKQDVARPRTQDSSYQTYLFGSAGSAESPAWSESVKGRAMIRLFSRGIVGAAFFAVGGRMAHYQLQGYGRTVQTLEGGATKEIWHMDTSKPLQWIARGFDATFGRAFESGIRTAARINHTPKAATEFARKAMTFRSTRDFNVAGQALKGMTGRTYGAEVVGITFDFAMASLGDAMTRNMIQAIDPNVRKPWLLNDKGEPAERGDKKHIDWGIWAKSSAKTAWRVFSKNQGEDWAAAVPYVFQMKFQRQFLNNIMGQRFRGHMIGFDNNWNGGAYKIDQTGKIIGDYQLAGAIDLHARFVGYNWYTLMFREAYDNVANAFTKWKENGFSIKPHWPENVNPITAAVDGVGHSLRYVTKSFIKANLYMNPAVIPFWMMRVPQSKWRSGLIHPDAANEKLGLALASDSHAQRVMPTLAEGINLREMAGNNRQFLNVGDRQIVNPITESHPYTGEYYKGFKPGFETGFSKFLNPIGKLSYKLGSFVAKHSEPILPKGDNPIGRFLGNKVEREKFMREYVDASLSYTPYMFAKAETALRVDDNKGDGKPGKMDQAIYRWIDNLTSFNVAGTWTATKDIARLSAHFEHEISGHEGEKVASKKTAPVRPVTTVQADSVSRRDVIQLSRDEGLDESHEKRWVETVMGRDYNAARVQPSTSTRH